MSYERSHPEVCSTTMGTRFKPRSFIAVVLLGWLREISTILSKSGELAKARRLIDDLYLRERPVESLILERRGLELLHRLATGEVLAPGILGIPIAGDDVVELLPDALPLGP